MKKLLTIILMLMSVLVTQAQQVSHTIQRGETLESIAQKYHISVDALKQANPDAVDVFYVGMKLIIPTTQLEGKNVEPTYVEEANPAQNGSAISRNYSEQNQTPSNVSSDGEGGLRNTWHLAFRLGPAFYKTEKTGGMKKEYGYSSTFSQSWGYEVSLGAHYYILDNLYATAMLGYYQASSSLSMNAIGSHNSTSVVSHNISMPIEIGAFLPVSKYLGFFIEAGPTFLYAVDGYTKLNKEKYSFSELEDDFNQEIDRFGAFLRVGGGIQFSPFRLQAYYGIPLSKFPGASEKKNFWGITLGWEM